jgi:ferredoxin
VKIEVDTDLCQGHGLCSALAPEVFQVDPESGYNQMGTFELTDESLWDAADRGATACPERAIAVVDPI